MCKCAPQVVVPINIEVGMAYWGYLHVNERFQIKRWSQEFQAKNWPAYQCDRCVAAEDHFLSKEKSCIQWIVPYPIYALDSHHAGEIICAIYAGKLSIFTWQEEKTRLFKQFELLDD